MKAFSWLIVLPLFAVCAAAQGGGGKTTREQLTPARAIAAARQMRDQLSDPESLRVVSFLYYEPESDSHFLCVIFRAKNEHGGLVLQNYANNAADDSPGGFNVDPLLWPIICKGPVVADATEAVKAALKSDRGKE